MLSEKAKELCKRHWIVNKKGHVTSQCCVHCPMHSPCNRGWSIEGREQKHEEMNMLAEMGE